MSAQPAKPDWLVQMEGILETLNEGVLIVDDCNQIIFANQCLVEMAGYPLEAVIGRGPSYFFQGSDLERATVHLARGQEEGRTRFEFFVPRHDGSRVPVIISSRIVEDLDGRQFAVITFTDISEQKHAQAQLREANQKLRERQEEIERELQLASRVQQSLAPHSLVWGPFAVEAYYMPVSTIGGDFGLVTPLGDDQLNLLVCDVSGHGISSALVANRIYSELVSLLERRADLPEMMTRLNDFVLQHIRLDSFYFSLSAVRIRDHSGRLSFASAGHPPALWVTPGGECRQLETRSTVLGMLPNAVGPKPMQEIELRHGDRIVLYTDGLTEAFNERDEMLGADGLQRIVCETAHLPLPEMKHAILDSVATWRHGPITDDLSLVLVQLE